MINEQNPLTCPACGHVHTGYPLHGRCAACDADLRLVIDWMAQARLEREAAGDPMAQLMQRRGCNAAILMLIVAFAAAFAFTMMPLGSVVKGLSLAWFLLTLATGVALYGGPAVRATPGGRRLLATLGRRGTRLFLYATVLVCLILALLTAWAGIGGRIG